MAVNSEHWTFVICLYTVASLGTAQLSPTPSDTTAELGTDVMLQCGYTGTVQFQWLEYVTISTGLTIFLAPPDQQPENSMKFGIEETYHLIVKQLALTDGGKYGCRSVDMPGYARAGLVVLEEPSLSIPPLTSGIGASITCTAFYGGPLDSELEHVPTVRLAIDDDPVSVTYQEHRLPIPGPPETYQLGHVSVTYNYTADKDNDQQNMTCVIHTDTPSFGVMTSHILEVRYPVENIAITPLNDFYYIGEQLNCSADGNPDPEFEWTPITSPGPITVSGPTLTIQSNMVGQNEWECTARNVVENTEILLLSIVFEVMDSSSPSGQPRCVSAWWSIHVAFLLVIFGHVV